MPGSSQRLARTIIVPSIFKPASRLYCSACGCSEQNNIKPVFLQQSVTCIMPLKMNGMRCWISHLGIPHLFGFMLVLSHIHEQSRIDDMKNSTLGIETSLRCLPKSGITLLPSLWLIAGGRCVPRLNRWPIIIPLYSEFAWPMNRCLGCVL